MSSLLDMSVGEFNQVLSSKAPAPAEEVQRHCPHVGRSPDHHGGQPDGWQKSMGSIGG
jgi:hypothetical protein